MGNNGDTNRISDDSYYMEENGSNIPYSDDGYVEKPKPRKKKRRKKRRRPAQRANKDVLKRLGQSVLAIIIAIALIAVVIMVAFGDRIKESLANREELGGRWLLSLLYPEKYSYGMDPANLKDYFQLFNDEDVAIILQDERIAAHAKIFDDAVYFSIDTIRDLFTKRFYVNTEENKLLYSTSDQVISNTIGEKTYLMDGQTKSFSFPVSRFGKDGTFYIAAEYVRLFADFDFDFHTSGDHINRVQVYTKWEEDRVATLKSDTQLRIRGGIKSEVLRAMEKGEEVEILETMETWSKVKTGDAFIGFIENRTLNEATTRTLPAATGAYHPENDYNMAPPAEQVLVGWHQIFDADDGSGMLALTESASGMNVVSPTWFFLTDEEGAYNQIARQSYVEKAHEKGYQVWALVENMESDFDEYALFSSSERRAALIQNLINDALNTGIDGINMDIEFTDSKLSKTGTHYVQFLRELSIETHKNGLVLSVDVPPPTESNKPFDFEELGYIMDYVILMAYDEHYSGSEAGSVASIGFVEKGLNDCLTKYSIPAEKIVCGMPFYTRIWKTEAGNVTSEAVGMDTAWEWVNNRNLETQWLDDICQYYAEYRDGTALYQVWLEDESAYRARTGLMTDKGIKSMAGWKLGLEGAGVWDVINGDLHR
ncbi:MAG: hypothetical protein J6X66_07985 [Lachnospiraceae bacterium]|nr:hypothetical protein [Lachnospiraceae bacterium]